MRPFCRLVSGPLVLAWSRSCLLRRNTANFPLRLWLSKGGMHMGRVQLPLSGNVTQAINPWTWVYSPTQVGQASLVTFNIDVGPSTNPEAEKDILMNVASYGKQLGRIEDALRVVIKQLEPLVLDEKLADNEAIIAFRALMYEIDTIKKQHRK
ncbi:hypothetical protein GOZ98_14055 [Agrobacterium vitis]|nr:hypothetical protein [Agrobacterium vitis]MVA18215.1 hypothetical protein [Agrobacterium vitis]